MKATKSYYTIPQMFLFAAAGTLLSLGVFWLAWDVVHSIVNYKP